MRTQLENDLADLQSALSVLATACVANGDIIDHGRVILASAQVSAAAFQAAAADIIANLPSDEDAQKVKDMLGKMGTAATLINNKQKSITDAVEIATGFANLVIDAASGNIPAAVSAVNGLIPFLS